MGNQALPQPAKSWLFRYTQNQSPRMRLFCFPYAGGGASIYNTWVRELPPDIELIAVQLPGRENLFGLAPLTDLVSLIQVLDEIFAPLTDKPYAFFGHSLGAFICFELARAQRRNKRAEPTHLFVSGATAPQILQPEEQTPVYQLPEAQFIERIRSYNGTPEVILNNHELLQLVLPILRADFQIFETYNYSAEEPLGYPISVFGGLQDPQVDPSRLHAWQEQTKAGCQVHMFPGDHFFLQSAYRTILEIICKSSAQER